jgi:hypothetical protein
MNDQKLEASANLFRLTGMESKPHDLLFVMILSDFSYIVFPFFRFIYLFLNNDVGIFFLHEDYFQVQKHLT